MELTYRGVSGTELCRFRVGFLETVFIWQMLVTQWLMSQLVEDWVSVMAPSSCVLLFFDAFFWSHSFSAINPSNVGFLQAFVLGCLSLCLGRVMFHFVIACANDSPPTSLAYRALLSLPHPGCDLTLEWGSPATTRRVYQHFKELNTAPLGSFPVPTEL